MPGEVTKPLTRARRALLEEIVEKGYAYVVETYKPAQALVALGYATLDTLRYGGTLKPTEAGRQYLKDHPQ